MDNETGFFDRLRGIREQFMEQGLPARTAMIGVTLLAIFAGLAIAYPETLPFLAELLDLLGEFLQ